MSIVGKIDFLLGEDLALENTAFKKFFLKKLKKFGVDEPDKLSTPKKSSDFKCPTNFLLYSAFSMSVQVMECISITNSPETIMSSFASKLPLLSIIVPVCSPPIFLPSHTILDFSVLTSIFWPYITLLEIINTKAKASFKFFIFLYFNIYQ